ncbi:MAG: glutathione S-transferase family protein [Terricaulis sp.]
MVRIYGHPFSSFTWKVLIALYEREVAFEFMMLSPEHSENTELIARLAPTGQFPVLLDGDRAVIESAAIIEYLDLYHGRGSPMVPVDPRAAIEARQMDRVFDDYVMVPVQRMVAAVLREEGKRDPYVEGEVQAALDKSYPWLNAWMDGRAWAANNTFGIADCAAAPALFYAHWAFPISESHSALRAYRARLLARRSVTRVVDEARPWRDYFPLKGRVAPD